MKTWAYTTITLTIAAGLAHAGMRHPTEQSTPEAMEVQSTRVHSVATYSSSSRIVPDRMPSNASKPTALPSQVKGQAAPSKVPGMPALPTSLPKQVRNQPALKSGVPQGPVPKAPGLPAATNLNIPAVHIPGAPGGDGLINLKPEKLSLRNGANRAQLHSYLRKAREMKLPVKEYAKDLQAAGIAQRYHAALHPTPYQTYRTPYKLSISGVSKITEPPSAVHYENMVKRIDSLFNGLEFHYPRAIVSLWELSESRNNARNLQARDALFAGILSERAGWEAPASNLLSSSTAKQVDREERYLKILWKELENIQNPVHIAGIVANVNPAKAKMLPLNGDKANFAMAKRMLLENHRAPLALNPPATTFLDQIQSRAVRDRFQLLSLVGQIRSSQGSARDNAVAALKTLEAEGDATVQQEARLAIARALLQKGSGAEALALYKNVVKNGKNRLEVLAEQTFAEYISGEYQDSLGKAVALQSPYFAYGFTPDIHLVEILSRKAMCDFGGAEASVQRFAERYGRELAALEATLSRKGAPASYYEELVSYHGLEQPMRFQRYMLQLPSVMENQKTMNQALGDLQKLDNLGVKQKIIERPIGWDKFAGEMRDRWGNRALELRKESAQAALREAAYMAKRLRHTFAQVELLDLDISTGAAKNYNLQSALNFPARKAEELALDADKFRWPYEEEIWEDEIDFMRSKKASKCAVAAR